MKIGQTSIIHYSSHLVSSALGFISTVYIARILGAEALGVYSLSLAVVSWLGLVGNMGVTEAVVKRVSEGNDPSAYAIAGGTVIFGLYVIFTTIVLIFAERINVYVGYPAASFLVVMLGMALGFSAVTSILSGRHLVHISGFLAPLKSGGRAIIQIAAITLGFGIAGLLGGYIVAYLIAIIVGICILYRDLNGVQLPTLQHFKRISSYSKYSWLGALRSRSFDWVDIAVLGFFVSQSFIGYYTAAWNIAIFLVLFGNSISTTIFPEMSKAAGDRNVDRVSELLNDALSYAGLILIPGLVGAIVLGERILRIYGEGFTQATTVLVILISAALFQSYQDQMKTTLNALDRPDLSFRVNILFIVVNVILNIGLISAFGWIGAALATTVSVVISLLVAYLLLRSIFEFQIPIIEIGKQGIAAGVMGGVVLVMLHIQIIHMKITHNIFLVLSTVTVGSGVYFVLLYCISIKFRNTVQTNLPPIPN